MVAMATRRGPRAPSTMHAKDTVTTNPKNAPAHDDAHVDPSEAAPTHPQFEPGTRVRDHFGNPHVVSYQIGCAVFMTDGERWHPTKVFAVKA